MIEKLYTVEEVAELASVTGRTIRNYLKSGRLVGRKIGGQWRFPENEVQRLLTGAEPEDESELARSENAAPVPAAPETPAPMAAEPAMPAPSEGEAAPPLDTVASAGEGDSIVTEEESVLTHDFRYTPPAPLPKPVQEAPVAQPRTAMPWPTQEAPPAPANLNSGAYPAYAAPVPERAPLPASPMPQQAVIPPQSPAMPQQSAAMPQAQPSAAVYGIPHQAAIYPQAYPQASAAAFPGQPVYAPPASMPQGEYPQQAYAPPPLQNPAEPAQPYAVAPQPPAPGMPQVSYVPPAQEPVYQNPLAYTYAVPAQLPQPYPPAPSAPAAPPPASVQATFQDETVNISPLSVESDVVSAESAAAAARPVPQDPSLAHLSDVGRKVLKFVAEVHDCSHGPVMSAMVDLHQSLSAARATSEKLANMAAEESDAGVLCQSYVEFDDRYYVARYTLFGTSSFLMRCLKLLG